jgi:CRP-like cAMP-binding protein
MAPVTTLPPVALAPLSASPLAGVGLFASLPDAVLLDIEPRFEQRTYQRDDVIFHEGEAPEWLFIVVHGYVKLIKHSDDGRDVILHVAMPGDLIGGVSAFGRRPHPFTAQAMVVTTALRVAGRDYADIMDAHPAVARQTLDDLIERLTEAHETMKSLAVDRVERRIARQLVRLAARSSQATASGIVIDVPLSRQDVADLAGTTVETAIRVLSRWRQAGLMRTEAGRLVILDVAGLRAVADESASL